MDWTKECTEAIARLKDSLQKSHDTEMTIIKRLLEITQQQQEVTNNLQPIKDTTRQTRRVIPRQREK